MSYIIEVRLMGEELTPEKISSRDIGEVITSVEAMIAAVVARDNPELGITENQVSIGLSKILSGSYIMQFETQYENESQIAYTLITQAISQNNYGILPTKSIDAIKQIRTITKRYDTDIQFWEVNGQAHHLAAINSTTKIKVEPQYIKGKTTLYGYITGIIGVNPPRVRVRLLNENYIKSFRVTTIDDMRIPRQLGERLYSYVGLRGNARWNIYDMSLDDFFVEELTPYKKKSVGASLDALYQIAGSDYEKIEDFNQLIADIRGNDEDT